MKTREKLSHIALILLGSIVMVGAIASGLWTDTEIDNTVTLETTSNAVCVGAQCHTNAKLTSDGDLYVYGDIYTCADVVTPGTSTNASTVIELTNTGFNSKSYYTNYQTMVQHALDPSFNTTMTVSNGTHTLLWVTWFDSSTACGMGNLKTYGGCSTTNSTRRVMVTDEFSEVGLALAMSNDTMNMQYWANTEAWMNSSYGSLASWEVCGDWSDGTIAMVDQATDTASDGTARIISAYCIAANNTNFPADNRSVYATRCSQRAADHLTEETITGSYSSAYGTITRLPMGGGNCQDSGLACTPDLWIGYFYDLTKAMLHAEQVTGNTAYGTAAENYIKAYLSVSLQNDTDGDEFGVGPFNFDYLTTGNLGHQNSGGANAARYNPASYQWDDSDAPRDRTCDTLRLKNLSGPITGVWTNLSTYCTAKMSSSKTQDDDWSCLQHYYNGDCITMESAASEGYETIWTDATETGTAWGSWFPAGADGDGANHYLINFSLNTCNVLNLKFHYDSTGSHGPEYYYCENTNIKHYNGSHYTQPLSSVANNSIITIEVNKTNNRTRICDDGSCGSWELYQDTDSNAFSVEWGGSGTSITLTTSGLYNYTTIAGVELTSGYYDGGYGALDRTHVNTSIFDDILNETMTHYSWAGKTYDSTSCGNALTYRGVRPLKAIGYGIGLDQVNWRTSTASTTTVQCTQVN